MQATLLNFLHEIRKSLWASQPRRQQLALERVFLRKYVKRYPMWGEGHVALGRVEAEFAELRGEKLGQRTLALLACCAKAGMRLHCQEGGQHLEGLVAMRKGQFADALAVFESLIQTGISQQDLKDRVLEDAGACAIALEETDRALWFLNQIDTPSAEAQAALHYLRTKQREASQG